EESKAWEPWGVSVAAEEGKQFDVPRDNTVRKCTWHRERDPVVVPAGTFNGECWALDATVVRAKSPQEMIGQDHAVFCPGVGPGLSVRETQRGYQDRKELISKNF